MGSPVADLRRLRQRPGRAHIDEPDIAADCQKVASYAELGKKAYQRQDYANAADIFRDQAARASFAA